MNVSKTDITTILRYLSDAARFYKQHAVSTRDHDRIRLINKMNYKLSKKLQDNDTKRNYQSIGEAH